MALNKLRGGLKAYWAEKSEDGSTQMFGNYYKRFDISRQEFEDIRTHLKLNPYTAADVVQVSDYNYLYMGANSPRFFPGDFATLLISYLFLTTIIIIFVIN